tara:strand:+ start:38188 stop:40515 length:2328 start_codon:yes stop_codon:yes gene_type:complete
MKYKYGILALLGLIILVSVYFYYTRVIDWFGDSVKEGLDGDILKQMKEANYDESQKYIKKQQKHFGSRELKTLEDGAHGDTVFLKISEDKYKTNYDSGKLGLEKDYSAYGEEKTEYQKKVEKCNRINKLKQCSMLEGADENGEGCGYCLDSDKIIFGGQKAPADPNNPGKFSNDVCGGGGQKNTWVPPGPNVAFECQKAKDRAYCKRMKDCGDTSVSDKCGWCPVTGTGMAKELKDGGFHPKYKDDKCDWPYKGVRTRVRWLGWNGGGQPHAGIGTGDCDTDKDCAPGLKCGQDPHRTKNTKGLKGSHGKMGSGQDYCYDPEFAGMNGPLVEVGECKKFGQKFPCMGPTMNTGPHSDACMNNLWKKSGCTGNIVERSSDLGKKGSDVIKNWQKDSYSNVLNSMYGILGMTSSSNYKDAKDSTKMCFGRDVDSCEDRFVDESKNKERPRDCLVNLYKQSGCRPKGRLHPDNIKATVRADTRKKHGVGKEWTSGTFYKWKPNEYVQKLRAVKNRADKLTAASNVDTYDEGIKLYENCYGTSPSVSTIPMKKPCWKDFVEIMKRSHKKVTISKDEQKVVFSKDSLGVDNEFMKDTNLNRTRLAGKDNIGHDWGGGKVVKKADYEKDFFPFWRFVKNSRDIYRGGGDKKWKNKWPEFKKRMLKINGVSDLGDETLLCAPFMGVGRTLRNYGLAKKSSMAHLPVNGKCSSCSLVPRGECQEGCAPVTHPDGKANNCPNKNKGKSPGSCIVPFGNVVTKNMWMKEGFPYWEFMRILQRYEK